MNLPSGLDTPAQRARERFETAYKAFLAKSQEISLSILVWGPNPQSDSPVAKKRVEIRDVLENLGHNAMFSEDISIQTGNVSEKTKEFAQAQASQLIIILVEGAPGALAETHDFCNHPDIAPNVYVMVPKKYEEGYSAKGAIKDLSDGYGGVYWYEDEDLQTCNVCKHAVKRAEARRRMWHFFERGGTYERP